MDVLREVLPISTRFVFYHLSVGFQWLLLVVFTNEKNHQIGVIKKVDLERNVR